eukprot:COSAG04_NODE_20_length_39202_cov_9.993530_21_plen_210_part_00
MRSLVRESTGVKSRKTQPRRVASRAGGVSSGGLWAPEEEEVGGSGGVDGNAIFRPFSPIFPPFFPVFRAFSPSHRGGSNEPQAGTQSQETGGKGVWAPEEEEVGGSGGVDGNRLRCRHVDAHLHLHLRNQRHKQSSKGRKCAKKHQNVAWLVGVGGLAHDAESVVELPPAGAQHRGKARQHQAEVRRVAQPRYRLITCTTDGSGQESTL